MCHCLRCVGGHVAKDCDASLLVVSDWFHFVTCWAPTSHRLSNDDTYVCILLMDWVWKANVHSAVQMEKWDGTTMEMPLSRYWDRNVRFSWVHACMPYQDVNLYPTPVEITMYHYLHWKYSWEVPCLVWIQCLGNLMPLTVTKTYRYRIVCTVWDEEESEQCSLPHLQM